jgi:hypothetical protein
LAEVVSTANLPRGYYHGSLLMLHVFRLVLGYLGFLAFCLCLCQGALEMVWKFQCITDFAVPSSRVSIYVLARLASEVTW